MVAEGGRSQSNELPRRLLARDLEAAQAAIQAGTDPALAQILSVALLEGDDGGCAALFHWRVEARGAPGTIFAGLVYIIQIDWSRRHPFEPPVVRLSDEPRNHRLPRLGDLSVVDHQGRIQLAGTHPERWLPISEATTVLSWVSDLFQRPGDRHHQPALPAALRIDVPPNGSGNGGNGNGEGPNTPRPMAPGHAPGSPYTAAAIPSTVPNAFSALSRDLAAHILGFLHLPELLNFSATARSILAHCHADSFWGSFYYNQPLLRVPEELEGLSWAERRHMLQLQWMRMRFLEQPSLAAERQRGVFNAHEEQELEEARGTEGVPATDPAPLPFPLVRIARGLGPLRVLAANGRFHWRGAREAFVRSYEIASVMMPRRSPVEIPRDLIGWVWRELAIVTLLAHILDTDPYLRRVGGNNPRTPWNAAWRAQLAGLLRTRRESLTRLWGYRMEAEDVQFLAPVAMRVYLCLINTRLAPPACLEAAARLGLFQLSLEPSLVSSILTNRINPALHPCHPMANVPHVPPQPLIGPEGGWWGWAEYPPSAVAGAGAGTGDGEDSDDEDENDDEAAAAVAAAAALGEPMGVGMGVGLGAGGGIIAVLAAGAGGAAPNGPHGAPAQGPGPGAAALAPNLGNPYYLRNWRGAQMAQSMRAAYLDYLAHVRDVYITPERRAGVAAPTIQDALEAWAAIHQLTHVAFRGSDPYGSPYDVQDSRGEWLEARILPAAGAAAASSSASASSSSSAPTSPVKKNLVKGQAQAQAQGKGTGGDGTRLGKDGCALSARFQLVQELLARGGAEQGTDCMRPLLSGGDAYFEQPTASGRRSLEAQGFALRVLDNLGGGDGAGGGVGEEGERVRKRRRATGDADVVDLMDEDEEDGLGAAAAAAMAANAAAAAPALGLAVQWQNAGQQQQQQQQPPQQPQQAAAPVNAQPNGIGGGGGHGHGGPGPHNHMMGNPNSRRMARHASLFQASLASVRVHFVGYPDVHDESVGGTTENIMPFRSITQRPLTCAAEGVVNLAARLLYDEHGSDAPGPLAEVTLQSFWAVGGQARSGGGRVRYLLPTRTPTVEQLVHDFVNVCFPPQARGTKGGGVEQQKEAASPGALSVVKARGWVHPVLSHLTRLEVTPIEMGLTLAAAGVKNGDVLEVVAHGHIPHEGSEFAQHPPKGLEGWM